MSEDAPSDSWRSVIQSLSSLDATTTTKESIVDSGFINPSWTRASLVAKRRTLKQRQEVLARALALQQAEVDRLDLWEKRVHNSLQPIGRLPVELLVMIFRYLRGVTTTVNGPMSDLNPAVLVAVCQRWMNIVMGPSGAQLWSEVIVACDSEKSFISASRWLELVLSRSRSLPFTLHLSSNAIGSSIESTLRERKTIAYVAAQELKRCLVLVVHNVPAFDPIFPLSGSFDTLERLHLNFHGAHVLPSLFKNTIFPSLRTLKLFDVRSQGRHLFGNASIRGVFPSCTELVLCCFRVPLHVAILVVDAFPQLASLTLDGLLRASAHDIDFMRANNYTTSLPDLQTVVARDSPSRLLLDFIEAPRLETLHLARLEDDVTACPRPDLRAHPSLTWLTLENMDRDGFQWADLIVERHTLRGLIVIQGIEVVHRIVGQLLKQAQERSGAPVAQNEDPFAFFLDIRSKEIGGQTNDDVSDIRELVSDLEALAAVRVLRERLYGAHFRVCLPDKLHPLVEELVSRYPGFLGTFVLDDINRLKWTSNRIL